MSESLPNNPLDPNAPDPEARSSVPLLCTARFRRGKIPQSRSLQAIRRPHHYLQPRPSAGFTVERGGRSGMSDTAERIGSAVGTAQRQMRRGLELVRRASSGETSDPSASSSEERASQSATDRVSSKLRQVQGEVTGLQRQAAQRMDEWSERAGGHFQQVRREVGSVLSLIRKRAQELAHEYPLQTIAASAGVCFALGMALRIRRLHRG